MLFRRDALQCLVRLVTDLDADFPCHTSTVAAARRVRQGENVTAARVRDEEPPRRGLPFGSVVSVLSGFSGSGDSLSPPHVDRCRKQENRCGGADQNAGETRRGALGQP
ncbi:hypothetical protein GCM10010497_14270 [Streptomyces cinereoruber]|uniref:Uncharacterized protein n=1 Tax=Streptomyces cinereoruber TaxID=67260 RepID=A0AAV4KGJ9_9ACTN|nr:hypothetical protein GCM10010497_14270 [Streptomyces cinereoruber]